MKPFGWSYRNCTCGAHVRNVPASIVAHAHAHITAGDGHNWTRSRDRVAGATSSSAAAGQENKHG